MPLHARRAVTLLAASLLGLLGLLAPPATAAAGKPDPTAERQAAYLAQELRASNIYLSDQLPRDLPRSDAPRLARAAARTGVPTYVIALPKLDSPQEDQLLDAVHRRLGRDGLYVLLTANWVAEARAYGVRTTSADADAAARAARYTQPMNDPALQSFERFVDLLGSGEAQAGARAADEKYRSGDVEPEPVHTTVEQREKLAGRLSILLGAVPAVVLVLFVYVRTTRHRPPPPQAGPAAPTPSFTRRSWLLGALAAVLTAAVMVAGAVVFLDDETRDDTATPPTARETAARTDRVIAGLKRAPVYADPETAPLSAAEQAAMVERVEGIAARHRTPVFVVALPVDDSDESKGDPALILRTLHRKTGRDGIYVVSGTGWERGVVVAGYQAPVRTFDAESTGRRLDIALPVTDGLNRVLDDLDKAVAAEPEDPWPLPEWAGSPLDDDLLPPLFAPGTNIGGAFVGVMLGGAFCVGAIPLGKFLRRKFRGTAS
ncbi:hypothetical protein [Streptomyces sp. NPDC051561]|uniref:hypothetical protein n=1 Tax=Streptomyces sp. NPDC051561 TaxID=3365658 RepID=UPI0037AE0B17